MGTETSCRSGFGYGYAEDNARGIHSATHLFFVNLPSGGLALLPVARRMDFVGQASMQVPQAKQSGMVLSRFRIASITVDGHAFSQERHPMQV